MSAFLDQLLTSPTQPRDTIAHTRLLDVAEDARERGAPLRRGAAEEAVVFLLAHPELGPPYITATETGAVELHWPAVYPDGIVRVCPGTGPPEGAVAVPGGQAIPLAALRAFVRELCEAEEVVVDGQWYPGNAPMFEALRLALDMLAAHRRQGGDVSR